MKSYLINQYETYIYNVTFTDNNSKISLCYRPKYCTGEKRLYKINLYRYLGDFDEIQKEVRRLNTVIVQTLIGKFTNCYLPKLLDFREEAYPDTKGKDIVDLTHV